MTNVRAVGSCIWDLIGSSYPWIFTWKCPLLWPECLYSPKTHMMKPYPHQCGGIGRCGLKEVIKIRWSYEGWALINGISAPKETYESLLPLSPLCHVRSWQSATWNKTLTHPLPHWLLDLRPPAPRTVRNKFLLFTNHPVCGTFVVTAKAKPPYSSPSRVWAGDHTLANHQS